MSTKTKIMLYLKARPGYVSGTELEEQAKAWQTKASTISRRARELADEGKIQVSYSFRHTAQYKALEPVIRPDYSNVKAVSWL